MSTQPRRKFTPRPPRPAEERLPLLYRALTDQVDDGHFQNAKRTCRKILALDPASAPAFQALLFLLLDTDEYDAALALVSAPPAGAANAGELEFERAYCLYRLKREGEALEVLAKVGTERHARLLEAQIRYRLGEYERARQIYEDLLSGVDSSSAEYDDIQTNLAATAAHLDFLAHGQTSHLAAPGSAPSTSAAAAELKPYTPTEAELETYVPGLPSGWGSRGVTKVPVAATSTAKADKKGPLAADGKRKTRHRLPKGASADKPFSGDRASYIAALSKRKGVKESMGTGFTQGSTAGGGGGGSGGGGGGGGGKNKKGKKK